MDEFQSDPAEELEQDDARTLRYNERFIWHDGDIRLEQWPWNLSLDCGDGVTKLVETVADLRTWAEARNLSPVETVDLLVKEGRLSYAPTRILEVLEKNGWIRHASV